MRSCDLLAPSSTELRRCRRIAAPPAVRDRPAILHGQTGDSDAVECVMAVVPLRSLKVSALSLALALLAGLLSTLAVPATPAEATPVVQVIGTDEHIGAGPLTITVGTPVPAGHSIIVIAFEENGSVGVIP